MRAADVEPILRCECVKQVDSNKGQSPFFWTYHAQYFAQAGSVVC